MKLLYLSSEDMRKEGGGKTHFIEVAQNLVKLGNELLILLPGYRPRDKKDYGLNIRYIPTFRKNIFSYLLYEMASFFYLTFYILKLRPDAIYIRQGIFEVFPPILARLFRVFYVVEKNGVVEDELRRRGFSEIVVKVLRLAEEINFRLSSKIVCVTEGIGKEIARRYKVPENKLVVIPNGVNVELFRSMDKCECRRRLGLKEDAFYVGFVGSFAPWQGLEVLIEAAKQVKEQGYSQIKYILVGDGEREHILRQKVQAYELENEICFTRRVAYKEVVYYINACDVTVAPFTRERNAIIGLSPLKLFEYLACGRPVIASRVNGVKEIVEEGQCGYLFAVGDAEKLMKRIIRSCQEREALQEMGLRGRKLVENKYTWRAAAERIVGVLNELVKKRNQGG